MKFIEPNQFADPDAAGRKLVEIANAVEAVQDGRIYIEMVNGAFLESWRHSGPGPRRSHACDQVGLATAAQSPEPT